MQVIADPAIGPESISSFAVGQANGLDFCLSRRHLLRYLLKTFLHILTRFAGIDKVVYGVFNEEDHRLNIYPSRGTPVEKGGVTYTTTFYALNSSYSASAQITIDFEPAEDGTLVLSEATEGVGFAVLYENPDDEEDYDFAMAWDQLQFAPSEAAGVPAEVAKRNAKQSIPARKATVKRPAKELVKKNIRLLNSNKEFQKNE